MTNLLPNSEKHSIQKEYQSRILVVVLCFFIIEILIATGFLLPTYFLAASKEREAADRIAVLKKSMLSDDVMRSILTTTNQKLKLLNTDEGKPSIQEIFARAAGKKVSGVSILSLDYALRSGQGGEVVLQGIAESREELVAFKKGLEQDTLFSEVVLPVSDLAKDHNVSFSITLHGAF
jgi:Tfp pilus assembly protein PilN